MTGKFQNIIESQRNRRRIQDLLLILAGSTLTAIATKYIFDPSGLVTGGVSGLTIVIRYLSETFLGFAIPLWVSNLVLNIPIFLFSIKMDGLRQILRTVLAWAIMTAELAIFPDVNFMPDNLLLVSLYGGVCFGAGTGLLLQARATSGGTDTLGTALHHFFRQYSMGRIIQVLDGIVVIVGAIVFSIENTLYAIISVFIMGKITDLILGRGKSAKIALIISDHSDEIAATIMEEMERGVTGITGTGMYTGQKKKMLMCICSNKDIVDMKDIVKKYDPRAFFIIGTISEAMGEGFVEYWT